MPIIPNCPLCKGESDINIHLPHSAHGAVHGLAHHITHKISHAAGNNPIIGVVAFAGMGAAALWARMGAEKKCLKCGHIFR